MRGRIKVQSIRGGMQRNNHQAALRCRREYERELSAKVVKREGTSS